MINWALTKTPRPERSILKIPNPETNRLKKFPNCLKSVVTAMAFIPESSDQQRAPFKAPEKHAPCLTELPD